MGEFQYLWRFFARKGEIHEPIEHMLQMMGKLMKRKSRILLVLSPSSDAEPNAAWSQT